MAPDQVLERLREYERELRALAEAFAEATPGTAPARRLRLAEFLETLNRDLLALYSRAEAGRLTAAERDSLLPAIEGIRDQLRGISTLRDAGGALVRLRAAEALARRA